MPANGSRRSACQLYDVHVRVRELKRPRLPTPGVSVGEAVAVKDRRLCETGTCLLTVVPVPQRELPIKLVVAVGVGEKVLKPVLGVPRLG